MKKIIFMIAIIFPLLATKCAQKPIYIKIQNNSKFDIIITSEKDTVLLKEMYVKGTFFQSQFNIIKSNALTDIDFSESSLNYYSNNNKDVITFYFFNILKTDSLNNKIILEKKVDSIKIKRKDIIIGEEGYNNFIYYNHKIIFNKN